MSLMAWPLLLILAQPVPAGEVEFPSPLAEAIRVDRGLQVIVYPDRVRLQYDLGLSPPAATAMLARQSRGVPDSEDRRALMEAFGDLVLPEIPRRCRVTVEGQPLEFALVERRLFPKHYVQLTGIFEAPLPTTGETIHLQLVDGSFRGCVGNHLIALKAAGGAQLQSSTVPLILARVPRESLSSDSAARGEAARRVEAVILRRREPTESTGQPSEQPAADQLAAAPGFAAPSRDPSASRTHPPPPTDTHWPLVMGVGGCAAVILGVLAILWKRGT